MSWLILFGLLLILCLPWLFLKWLEARQRKRERYWQQNGDRHSRYDSITRLLRSSSKSSAIVANKSVTTVAQSVHVESTTQTAEDDDWGKVKIPKQDAQTPVEKLCLKPNHRRNVETARQILENLRSQTNGLDPTETLIILIGALRRINPFVFEELLLHCFKDAGYQVVRNSRYTGDDGIDGRIYRDGKLYYVQAKRYSGLIDAAHLSAFEQKITNSYGVEGGFFVHTGRTGNTAKAISRQQAQVTLLSGMGLVDFVLGRGELATAQREIP